MALALASIPFVHSLDRSFARLLIHIRSDWITPTYTHSVQILMLNANGTNIKQRQWGGRKKMGEWHIKWITASHTGVDDDDFPSITFSLTISNKRSFTPLGIRTYVHLDFWSISLLRIWLWAASGGDITATIHIQCCCTNAVCQEATSHAIRALFYQTRAHLECVHLNCKNIKIIHWFNAIDERSHKKWQLSKYYCFNTQIRKRKRFRSDIDKTGKRWAK